MPLTARQTEDIVNHLRAIRRAIEPQDDDGDRMSVWNVVKGVFWGGLRHHPPRLSVGGVQETQQTLRKENDE